MAARHWCEFKVVPYHAPKWKVSKVSLEIGANKSIQTKR